MTSITERRRWPAEHLLLKACHGGGRAVPWLASGASSLWSISGAGLAADGQQLMAKKAKTGGIGKGSTPAADAAAAPETAADGTFQVVFPNEGSLGINMYSERGEHLVEPAAGSSDNAAAVATLSPGGTLVAVRLLRYAA